MDEPFELIGDPEPVRLDNGITILAPGLHGNGACLAPDPQGGSRNVDGGHSIVDVGLAENGLASRHVLVIDAPTPPAVPGGSGARASGNVDEREMVLDVPSHAPNEKPFAIYRDEAGVISFHYPQREAGAAGAASRADGADAFRFRIPLRSGQSRKAGDDRGDVGRCLAKAIKIVFVKVFPNAAGKAVARAVRAWEDKYRSFRGFHGGPTWQTLLDTSPRPIDDFGSLRGQRTLLLIHGTTSTTAGAFGGLKQHPGLLNQLYSKYGGRVVGFQHATMTTSIAENVRDLWAALDAAPGDYTFDVICHSRGGLLARALSDLADDAMAKLLGQPWNRGAGTRVHVDRIVFVATPNAGTDLAIPDRISTLVERLVNYLNLLPDSAVTLAAGGLLSIVAALAESALPRLPGLADQDPSSDLISSLRTPAARAQKFFAFEAEFEANGNLLDVVKDGVMDKIFQEKANDLVVPTAGVSSTLRLPRERVVSFGKADGVHHTNFFKHQSIAQIADFLEAR
jgi:hypothetical protein